MPWKYFICNWCKKEFGRNLSKEYKFCSKSCQSKGNKGRKHNVKGLDNYMPEPNSGCWFWMGARDTSKHAIIKYNGKLQMVHRVLWKMHKPNEILLSTDDLHHNTKICSSKSCVNPDHLIKMTHSQHSSLTNSANVPKTQIGGGF